MNIKALKYEPAEYANTMTHAVGLLLAAMGTPFMLYSAWDPQNTSLFSAVAFFCFASLLVYSASTMYHAVPDGPLKHRLHMLDHISIYLMIAGTHTPFVLKYIDGMYGNLYLAALWAMVVVGIVSKIRFFGRYKRFSISYYLLLGWMAILVLPFYAQSMPLQAFLLIISGGFAYTVGVAFYMWRSLPYHHAVWHVFVLIGSITHFYAIFMMIA